MTAFDLDPNLKWLFCLTHPDDELAVAAWIRRLVQAGATVHLSWSHATEIRQKEARNAAKELGVPVDRLHFHGRTDRHICDEMRELQLSMSEMFERVNPDRVVVAAFEQGHLDHDATHVVARRAFDGVLLEFPEYWPYTPLVKSMNRFADPTGEEVIHLDEDERAFKRKLAKAYPSQTIFLNLLGFETWSAFKGRRARLLETERLRIAKAYDFRATAVPAPYRSRVERSRNWRRWLAALDRFENGP